jgi:hypothetical protein
MKPKFPYLSDADEKCERKTKERKVLAVNLIELAPSFLFP